MKLIRCFFRFLFFSFFMINAYNITKHIEQNLDIFNRKYSSFERFISKKLPWKIPSFLKAENIFMYSPFIVLGFSFIQMMLAIGAAFGFNCAGKIVGIFYLLRYLFIIEIFNSSLKTLQVNLEDHLRVLSLVIACLMISCCGRKYERCILESSSCSSKLKSSASTEEKKKK